MRSLAGDHEKQLRAVEELPSNPQPLLPELLAGAKR